MAATMWFGMAVQHPFTISPVPHIDIVERRDLQFSRIANGAARYDFPNTRLQNLKAYDPKLHEFLTQLEESPTRRFKVDAPQIHNRLPATGIRVPATTETLIGLETQVEIRFAGNLTQAQADAIARRYFNFGNHDKLYLLKSIGVAVGSRTGTMTFTPGLQAQLPSATVVNFTTPQISVALSNPPLVRTTADGFWTVSGDFQEDWK